jgi:ribosomal-protein-alanine N-acetyltransferase
VKLSWARPGDAAAMAAAHALAFPAPWGASEFETLLESSGVLGLTAQGEDGQALGLALCRLAAGEMEVLTIGVAPHLRRAGVGGALMAAVLGAARQAGAGEVFLEVAIDNAPAVGLYERLGFTRSGVRRGYYDRGANGRVDALVMRLDLNAPAA